MRKFLNYLHSNFTISAAVLIICVFTLFVQNPFPPYKNYTHDKNCIFSDGFGYYSYLPAIFIYHDLSFSFFNTAYKKNYHGDPPSWSRSFIVSTKTGIVNKYWIGVSILLLPFFLIAHWLSLILGYDADGYSTLYQYAVFCAAFFYLYWGCRFIYKYLTANLLLSKTISSIAVFTIVFGTNLFYYSIYEPSMSHVYSFFCISGFCYYTTKYFKSLSFISFTVSALFLTIIILVRPVNAISILFLPFLAGNSSDFISGVKNISGFGTKLLLLIPILSLLILQILLWHKQCHNWIVWSYPGEKFYFSNPHYFDILFSYRKGFFVYMPVCFMSLLGFLFYYRKNKFLFYALLLSNLFIIYVLSSWYAWHYSACFGNRAFIDFYFVFALLIALSFKTWDNKIAFWLLCSIYTILIFFNHIQIYQYRHSIYNTIEMSKDDYWKVFLKTGKGYENLLFDWSSKEDLPRLAKLKKSPFLSLDSDFETPQDFWTNNHVEEQRFALSGNKVAVVSVHIPYGDGLLLPEQYISVKKNVVVQTSLYAYLYNELSSAYIVHQMTNSGNVVLWKAYKISTGNASIKKWCKISYLSDIKELSPGDRLEVFILNAGNSSLYIDDCKITLSSY